MKNLNTKNAKRQAKITELNSEGDGKPIRDKSMFMLNHIVGIATKATEHAQGVAEMSDVDTAQVMMIAGKVLVCWAAGQLDEAGLTFGLLRTVDADTAKVASLFAQGAL